jgi:hypothetical protein
MKKLLLILFLVCSSPLIAQDAKVTSLTGEAVAGFSGERRSDAYG